MSDHLAEFELLAKIGEGGMGTVFRAHDRKLDRIVALKVMRKGFDDPKQRHRFEQEARSAAGLENPNIITIYSIGEHEGMPYIAMELVKGVTLARLVQTQAPLALGQKLRLLESLCSGLAYAHKRNIIHRDIKPANLMLTTTGVLKILDFGIAKALRATGAGATRTLIGTPNYMAPEQFTGVGEPSVLTDIFSVGTVCYELLTYAAAFPGQQMDAISSILYGQPAAVSLRCDGADAELDAIVMRAMAKSPGDRYQDLDSMRRDLLVVRKRLEPIGTETAPLSIPDALYASEDLTPPASRDETTKMGLLLVPRAPTTWPVEPRSVEMPPAIPAVAKPRTPATLRRRFVGSVAVVLMLAAVVGIGLWRRTRFAPAPARSTADQKPNQSAPSPPPNDSQDDVSSLASVAESAIDLHEYGAALVSLTEGLTRRPDNRALNADLDRLLVAVRDDTAQRLAHASTAITSDPDLAAPLVRARNDANAAARVALSGKRIEAVRLFIAINKTLESTLSSAHAPAQATQKPVPSDEPATRPTAPVSAPAAETRAPVVEPVATPPQNAAPPDGVGRGLSAKETDAPAPPPIDQARVDHDAVVAVLNQYRAAYEHLDARALRVIWPTGPDLATAFKQIKTYRLDLTDVAAEIRGDSATVTCVRKIVMQEGAANPQSMQQPTTFTLIRHGESWLISRID